MAKNGEIKPGAKHMMGYPESCRFTWTVDQIDSERIAKEYFDRSEDYIRESDVIVAQGFKWKLKLEMKRRPTNDRPMNIHFVPIDSQKGRQIYHSLIMVDQMSDSFNIRRDRLFDYKKNGLQVSLGFTWPLPYLPYTVDGVVIFEFAIALWDPKIITTMGESFKNGLTYPTMARTDVVERTDFYAIMVDMPGLINIKVQAENNDDNDLLIEAQYKKEEKDIVGYVTRQRKTGDFSQRIVLPIDADSKTISQDKIRYADGVLNVKVNKKSQMPLVIKVTGNEERKHKKIIIKPRSLDIVHGDDPHYWRLPKDNESPAELLKVSWLEVKGSIGTQGLKPGTYQLIFKVGTKPDVTGWMDRPVHIKVNVGKKRETRHSVDLSGRGPGSFDVPQDLKFELSASAIKAEKKISFSLYETQKGIEKRGLLIYEVVLSSV